MSKAQEVIEGWRGVCVECGLGHPATRGFCAAVVTGTALFALKLPPHAFDKNSRMRPREAVEAWKHFLAIPLGVGLAISLCT